MSEPTPQAAGPVRGLGLTIAVVALSLLAIVGLQFVGRSSRTLVSGDTERLPTPIVVDTSEELLESWRRSGARGRTVVYFSRFLHFVAVKGVVPEELDRFPIATFDLVEAGDLQASPRNFLWLSMSDGIARRIVHVLPPLDYQDRRRQVATGTPGIRLRPDSVSAHESGSPRLLTDRIPDLDEPVILAVDASYLDADDAPPLDELLRAATVRSDLLILNLALDNPDVGEIGRARLSQLAATLGATHP